MTTYILGAGASHHAGYPLASKLGSALLDWLRLGNLAHTPTDYRANMEQVRELYGGLDNLEQILTDLDERPPFSPAATLNPGVTPGLRDSFRISIPEYFHDLLLRSPSLLYERLAREAIQEGDVVITFNYDVACERELKRAGLWEISDGYGEGFALDLSGVPPSKVKTLKLHGSVNWIEIFFGGVPCGQFSNALGSRPVIYGSRYFECFGYPGDVHDPACGATSNVGGRPALIMGLHKHFHSETSYGREHEDFWSRLWHEAEGALDCSEKIVLIGYSMPAADEEARELLLQGANRDAEIIVCCRGASSCVRNEFESHGFRRVKILGTGTFEDYLAR